MLHNLWSVQSRRYPSSGIKSVSLQHCSQLAEELYTCSSPIWELIVSVPAPCCDYRKREDPAHAEEILIGVRIVPAHRFGHMSDVELDRPAATRLQVGEEQSLLRPEHIARVWLAVQQLLGGATVCDRPP
jgi:hypothetical protein